MKKLILIALLLGLFYNANAQISAVTSGGKKVILNTNGTWKYAAGNETGKPCAENNTGNVTFKNNTQNDLYIYYTTSEYSTPIYTRVKASSSKTIPDLLVKNLNGNRYYWAANLELIENKWIISMNGNIAKGEFSINQCENTEVDIE